MRFLHIHRVYPGTVHKKDYLVLAKGRIRDTRIPGIHDTVHLCLNLMHYLTNYRYTLLKEKPIPS